MSFVGTRPEAVKYVDAYKKKYYATLLLPAGITSVCSIKYKDEAELLDGVDDPDRTYIEEIVSIVIYLLISKALKVDSLSYVKSTLNEVKSRKHENKEEK